MIELTKEDIELLKYIGKCALEVTLHGVVIAIHTGGALIAIGAIISIFMG